LKEANAKLEEKLLEMNETRLNGGGQASATPAIDESSM